ncbi:MAG: PRTRC system protein F [Sulfuritalea sp.]|nr:PRTRC system protein F [Sulfuritalea sp.]
MESPDDLKRWSIAALNWLAAGYIPHDADPYDPVTRVREAVSRWTAEHCGELPNLQIGLVVTCNPNEFLSGYEDDDAPGVHGASCAMATYAEGFDGYRLMEPRTRALETAHKGLGETALYWLNRAIWKVEAGVATPNQLRELCVNHMWYGADTQKDFMEEHEAMNGDGETFDGLSPAVFDAEFPEWVIKPREVLGTKQLQRIALKKTGAGAVAKVLIDLIDALNTCSGFEPNRDLIPVVATAALRWNSEDSTTQVIDDLDDYLGQCETATDQLAVMPIPQDAEQFKAWLDSTSSSLRIFNLLDQLIGLISVKEKTS